MQFVVVSIRNLCCRHGRMYDNEYTLNFSSRSLFCFCTSSSFIIGIMVLCPHSGHVIAVPSTGTTGSPIMLCSLEFVFGPARLAMVCLVLSSATWTWEPCLS